MKLLLYAVVFVHVAVSCAKPAKLGTLIRNHTALLDTWKTLTSPINGVHNPATGLKEVGYHYQYDITDIVRSKRPGQKIFMELLFLEVPGGCDDDSLRIWDGTSDNAKLLFPGCNSTGNRTFTSSKDSVRLRFLSNDDGNDYHFGYILKYKSVEDTTPEQVRQPSLVSLPQAIGAAHGSSARSIDQRVPSTFHYVMQLLVLWMYIY